MGKLVKIIAVILALGSVVPAAHAEDLATRDWSLKALKPLDKSPPAAKDVGKFASRILESTWESHVCSFKFLPLPGNDNYYLIVSLDVSGRHLCNQVAVIGKRSSGFALINEFKVWMVGDVSRALRDLDHDDIPDLVVPEIWMAAEGLSRCHVLWGRVYQWRGGHYVDNSDAYPELYKQRLKELQASMPQEADPSCKQVEADKIMRFLGLSPNAGFARAVDWMNGNNRALRRKAAAVFADINDDESRKNLAILANDSDPLVAESAKADMEKAMKH